MTVTLRDVARAAKVSISTASRALSGNGLANRNTEQRLKRIAEELGYRPNTLARGLKTANSQLVGLVVHNLVNASFQTLAEVVQMRLGEEGYQAILCITSDDPAQEARTLATLAEHRIDGLIVVPTGHNGDQLTALDRGGTPVVSIIRRNEGTDLDTVLAGDPEGAFVGTSYLIDLGHRRIGLVVGRGGTTSGRERLSGYLRALREHGLQSDPALIHVGSYEPETGAVAARALLDMADPPTALFIANHESTFGVLRVLSERGVAVPERLSVLCYEDVPWFGWQKPAISVVDNGAFNMANLAVDLLLQRMGQKAEAKSGAAQPPDNRREFRVGARLVARESCRALT